MKELVVISGKGGSGKTSVVASLAALARRCVLVDCDVDAADLHLIFEPKIVHRESFLGGSKARIKPGHCTACGKCEELCRFDAIFLDGPENGSVSRTFRVEETACEGCGVCLDYCNHSAIAFAPVVCGEWFVSETRCGPMVHARLGVAADNSGKLVTQVRRAAQEVAAKQAIDLVLCDGSPGVGCPVIASLTGASAALFVVEPTVSGVHDFLRVAQVAARLSVPGLVMVNKADLNIAITEQIESMALQHGIITVGRVPYDRDVTRAQINRKALVELSSGCAARAIHVAWEQIQNRLASVIAPSASSLVQIST